MDLVDQLSLGYIQAKGHDGHCFEASSRTATAEVAKHRCRLRDDNRSGRLAIRIEQAWPTTRSFVPERPRIVVDKLSVEVLDQSM